jgi:hypothetical protein
VNDKHPLKLPLSFDANSGLILDADGVSLFETVCWDDTAEELVRRCNGEHPTGAAIDDYREDAARYRWITENADRVFAKDMIWTWDEAKRGVRDTTLDAAIDAARKGVRG